MAKKDTSIANNENLEKTEQSDNIHDGDSVDDSDFLERIKHNVDKQGWFSDLKICFGVLTRLPIYIGASPEDFSISEASRFFPVIGAVIGLIASVVVWIGVWLGFPPILLALFALLTIALVTGALHEDGLADTFDGLGGGITRNQKLEIMRDSQIGSYGVMALLFSFGIRWAAFTEISELGYIYFSITLISTAAGSRAALPIIMHLIPAAREDGLSTSAGKPSLDRALIALFIGVGVMLFFLGFRATIVALGISVVSVGFFVYFVAIRIGGQTGDVLGASQQIADVAMLLSIVMVGFE